jgi:arylsulfatase A-like enzyme
MVSCLDDAVGRTVAALEKHGMRENTLILFSSDNGGPEQLGATNGPLRAGKGTLYEGGVRVVAFANWPKQLKPRECREPLHIVDWYPTILKLAGAALEQKLPLDGRDAWATIAEGKPSPREEILHNLEPSRGAVRVGDWKLVESGGRGLRGREAAAELFNIAEDPNEAANLAEKHPEKVKELSDRLEHYRGEAVEPKGGGGGAPRNFKAPPVWGEFE